MLAEHVDQCLEVLRSAALADQLAALPDPEESFWHLPAPPAAAQGLIVFPPPVFGQFIYFQF